MKVVNCFGQRLTLCTTVDHGKNEKWGYFRQLFSMKANCKSQKWFVNINFDYNHPCMAAKVFKQWCSWLIEREKKKDGWSKLKPDYQRSKNWLSVDENEHQWLRMAAAGAVLAEKALHAVGFYIFLGFPCRRLQKGNGVVFLGWSKLKKSEMITCTSWKEANSDGTTYLNSRWELLK